MARRNLPFLALTLLILLALTGAALGQASKVVRKPSVAPPAPVSQADTRPADVRRGEYLVKAAGCLACHTAEAKGAVPFAGGRALKTPFGTFYGPNITPHPQAGIGNWTEADFVRALRQGMGPGGRHLYPAFPYPSFTRITDGDLHDLWAYLRSLPPNATPNRPHELRFPFQWRFLLAPWKWLFFKPGVFVTDPKSSAQVNRGAYLVNALGHCGECHTERNLLGAVKANRFLAGAGVKDGAPNITPARLKWSDAELKEFLLTGMTPDFDAADATMKEVIENTTSQLTPEDLGSLMAYLRQIPAVPSNK
jgi:mono/diheme cytochrome c family protein